MINPQKILDTVADYFCISEVTEIIEPSNHNIVSTPRQVAMYMMKNLLGFKVSAIADIFRRNHSTVIRSIQVVEKRMKEDERYRKTVEGIRETIMEPELKIHI